MQNLPPHPNLTPPLFGRFLFGILKNLRILVAGGRRKSHNHRRAHTTSPVLRTSRGDSPMVPSQIVDAQPVIEATLPALDSAQRAFLAEFGNEGVCRVATLVFSYLELAENGTESDRREFRESHTELSDLHPTAQTYLLAQLDAIDRRFAYRWTQLPELPGFDAQQRAFVSQLGSDGVNRIGRLVFQYIDLWKTGSHKDRSHFRSEVDVSDLGQPAESYLSFQLDEIDRRHTSS